MDYTNNTMNLMFGDGTLGVHGNGFSYLFSYSHGGLESLCMNGNEWLYRVPKPTFWRATTDNDRGNKFPYRSGMWLGADLFLPCKEIHIYKDNLLVTDAMAPHNNTYAPFASAQKVEVQFTYETITVPSTNVVVSYIVRPSGSIEVTLHYYGKQGLPELPVFGLRLIVPTKAIGYRYEGLSGETYPDRMDGGIPGIYEVEGLPVTPYLVPQDCGMHMNTTWLEVLRNTTLHHPAAYPKPFGLKISALTTPFAFSCLPYTASELENATHQEELPPTRRTVISILGAVRGVGGIDSWGSDVEAPYHIDATKDITFSFLITGI